MLPNYITCCKCKEEQSWEEPEGYTYTNLMPEGTFTNNAPGEWVCVDCSYCEECDEDLVADECICMPKITLKEEE